MIRDHSAWVIGVSADTRLDTDALVDRLLAAASEGDNLAFEAARAIAKLQTIIAKQKEAQTHSSDCAIYNEPAKPAGPCDCGVEKRKASART